MSIGKKTIVAVMAATVLMAGMSVASASAARFVAMASPAKLQGTATSNQVFKLNGITTTCKKSDFSAELTELGQPIKGAPSFGECTYADIKPMPITVAANTCKYEFNAGAETSPGHFEGTMGIGPAGCEIKLSAPSCNQTIPAQSAHASVTYTNGATSPQQLTIQAEVENVQYTSSGMACGNKSGSDGRIVGSWLASAKNSGGTEDVPLFVESHDGLYAGGPITPNLSAEVLPATISGEQNPSSVQKFTFGSKLGAECSSTTFSGSISSASSQFDLAPSYSGCILVIEGAYVSATVSVNGCTYRNTLTGLSPVSGSVALNCAAGKVLELNGPGCKVKLSGQTLASATYENSIGVTGRSVLVAASGSGLSYSTSGFLCGTGSGSSGTYAGGTILR